jgi:hypothetical protein
MTDKPTIDDQEQADASDDADNIPLDYDSFTDTVETSISFVAAEKLLCCMSQVWVTMAADRMSHNL